MVFYISHSQKMRGVVMPVPVVDHSQPWVTDSRLIYRHILERENEEVARIDLAAARARLTQFDPLQNYRIYSILDDPSVNRGI